LEPPPSFLAPISYTFIFIVDQLLGAACGFPARSLHVNLCVYLCLIFLLPYELIGCCLACYWCHLLELFELNVILIKFACEAYVFFGMLMIWWKGMINWWASFCMYLVLKSHTKFGSAFDLFESYEKYPNQAWTICFCLSII
jgi:hypothetical protein